MIIDEAHEHVVEEENYFVSMTDMMVGLIFIFLILLTFSALQFREETDRLDGSGTREALLKSLDERLRRVGVDMRVDPETGVARLSEKVLFESGQAQLKPEGRAQIAQLARQLMGTLPCYVDQPAPTEGCPPARHLVETLLIEGHTDGDALAGSGALRDNWDLSVARATNTYRELVAAEPRLAQLCMRKPASERCEPVLSVSGYGAQRPVKLGDDPASKQENRRIDLRFIMSTTTAPTDAGG